MKIQGTRKFSGIWLKWQDNSDNSDKNGRSDCTLPIWGKSSSLYLKLSSTLLKNVTAVHHQSEPQCAACIVYCTARLALKTWDCLRRSPISCIQLWDCYSLSHETLPDELCIGVPTFQKMNFHPLSPQVSTWDISTMPPLRNPFQVLSDGTGRVLHQRRTPHSYV